MIQLMDNNRVQHTIKRLALEIAENNYQQEKIYIAGINNNGMNLARLIIQAMSDLQLHQFDIELLNIRLNPAKPLEKEITISSDIHLLENQTIIIVDDVANSGRTLYYALKPLLQIIPSKVEIAVLVERQHRLFPVRADYVGLSLATTLLENIVVQLQENQQGVFLN